MALRQIRTQGDDILAKECRKVEKMTPKKGFQDIYIQFDFNV